MAIVFFKNIETDFFFYQILRLEAGCLCYHYDVKVFDLKFPGGNNNMKSIPKPLYILMVLAMLAGMIGMQPVKPVQAISPDLRISQVYGGGGNSDATYTHDFIEIFNSGSNAVSLSGMSVQYASGIGTGNFGSNSTQITELPDITLDSGHYYLIQEASSGSIGAPLPVTADFTDTTPINMSGSGGKVALVNSQTSLGCNGSSTVCSPAQLALIVDLVGYGGANFYEGTAAAPVLGNSTSAQRKGGGCIDTDDNGADFEELTPAPEIRLRRPIRAGRLYIRSVSL
ncbi:MAG: lamin tail domain-containing protein, partial [Anaerolineaceae bacterium]|nr:lamin tail domain-containing protein [Anaerolineaceae bacterium]